MNRPQRTLWALSSLILVVVPLGCASTHAPTGAGTPPDSGIDGHTMVDGGCPVVRQGTPCPDRPLRARVSITAADSATVVASTVSGADGYFRVPLPAGTYILHPANLTGAVVPIAQPVTVTVRQGAFTTVTVPFDSGIR